VLTVLGRSSAPADAVDLLLECHDRIRNFLALARRIAERGAGDPAGVPEAAERVRRYVTQALPLHARDEEESILPRLRGRDPALDAALATMTREHLEHEPPLAALVEACEALAEDPARLPDLAPAVLRATAELEHHFAAHLQREEEVVFPAMRRLFDAATDAAVVAEIRARRGVGTPATPAAAAGPGARAAAPGAAEGLVGTLEVRDSARRAWRVDVLRDRRGRSLLFAPVHGDLEPFRASADGHRPDAYLAISPEAWATLARLAAAGATPDDPALRAEAFPLVDRMVRDAQHALLLGAADDEEA
jgi:hemerythrin-like domain-containing protein